jgi:hypothetical protein
VYEARVADQTEIRRNILQGTAKSCTSAFGTAWKSLFPIKAAEELAARAGMSKRAADYQLSGECEPSARAVAALVVEVTKRRT